MNVLVIDCYGETQEQRHQAEEFIALVKSCFPGSQEGRQDPTIDVRGYKNNALQDIMWVQKGDWGVDPKVLDTARLMFRDQDADGSGDLDQGELFSVIGVIMSRMGTELDEDFLNWMEEQVGKSMQLYDTDCNGTLDEEEFVGMLQGPPWCSLFPEDTRKKEAAIAALKKFCLLDIIIVDGDPNLLPWHSDCEDLLQVVWQVYTAQKWPGGGDKCIAMIGTTMMAQLTTYLAAMGPTRMLTLGSMAGFGSSHEMESVDTNSEAVEMGYMYFNNGNGNVHRYDSNKQRWDKAGNVCMQLNATARRPNRYRPKMPGQMDNTDTTRVARETKHIGHWLFEGLKQNQFPALCVRMWDICLSKEAAGSGDIEVIASSARGPEILEIRKSSILTMWPFMKQIPETVHVLRTFCDHFEEHFAYDGKRDCKAAWFDWLVVEAGQHKLEVKLPDRSKEKFELLQSPIPSVAAFTVDGRRSCPRPRTVSPSLLRPARPDPANVFRGGMLSPAVMHMSNRPKRKVPLHERLLSPKSDTPINPKSDEYLKSPEGLIMECFQSTRSAAEQCLFSPKAILSQNRSQAMAEGVVRPHTSLAVLRPLAMVRAAEEEEAKQCKEEEKETDFDGTFDTGSMEEMMKKSSDKVEKVRPSFNTMPQRLSISRMGVGDCTAYRRIPPKGYKAPQPPLSPTKYETQVVTYKVRNQSPRKGRPYCGLDSTSGASYSRQCTASPPTPTYLTTEGVWRAAALAKRRQQIEGEYNLSFPKEGEYFGNRAMRHFLGTTSPSVQVGGPKTGSALGGHFERTLKPVHPKQWKGDPAPSGTRAKDFRKCVAPLSPSDKLLYMGSIKIK